METDCFQKIMDVIRLAWESQPTDLLLKLIIIILRLMLRPNSHIILPK